MNLIIVDGDCRNLWSMPELERLLDAGGDTLWFCEDVVLRERDYNAASAAKAAIGAVFEKAVLLTKLQNGVMDYHKKMLRNTVGCKRWLIVIVGEISGIYKAQYRSEINSVLGNSVRYELVFDNSPALSLALEAKREIVDDRPLCIIATKADASFAEEVQRTLESAWVDWRFECHVGSKTDDYRHADVILIIGRREEDFAVPTTESYASRVQIWLETARGERADTRAVLTRMNQSGWNLGQRRIWSSNLVNEILLQELQKGNSSIQAICTDDRFVMWDKYGLPLSAQDYEATEHAEAFLRDACCFPSLLDC